MDALLLPQQLDRFIHSPAIPFPAGADQMASSSSQRGGWSSPERTVVWTEPSPSSSRQKQTKVAVVYYLCRTDGQLEHPHFVEMELPLAAPGLYLRDFTARLNKLRGDGMADMYAWSCKRSYRNGYVWQDLTDDDLIHPAHANHEYVLKGSQLLLLPPTSSGGARAKAGHRRNWSAFDLPGSYKVRSAGDDQLSAATQTDERRQELGMEEISPPPSSSSPDDRSTTLETLIAAAATQQSGVAVRDGCSREREVGAIAGGRMRASALLMQLISCGSITVKEKDQQQRLPLQRHTSSHHTKEERAEEEDQQCSGPLSISGGGATMDRDYFSGSLVETSSRTTTGALNLRRSSSYNAAAGRGGVKLELATREVDGVRARCIPRKPKSSSSSSSTAATRREADGSVSSAAAAVSSSDGVVDGRDDQ
ncbi:hypothetical protein ACP70R_035981 [Stipagrostis hirtigluma subsp. patula]